MTTSHRITNLWIETAMCDKKKLTHLYQCNWAWFPLHQGLHRSEPIRKPQSHALLVHPWWCIGTNRTLLRLGQQTWSWWHDALLSLGTVRMHAWDPQKSPQPVGHMPWLSSQLMSCQSSVRQSSQILLLHRQHHFQWILCLLLWWSNRQTILFQEITIKVYWSSWFDVVISTS